MDLHDRIVQLAGRDTLFRPIEFERYRKPHVVEYPRHAVVLNPHHTRQQQQQLQRAGKASTALSNSDDEDGEGEGAGAGLARRRGDADVDDDDPRYMAPEEYLCSDDALAKVLHLRWKGVGPVGAGLVNLGNTCFANAVLQSIAYTPALAQLFAYTYKAQDVQLGAPYDFAFALGETIRQVHLGRSVGSHGGAYRPSLIVGHLRALSTHFQLGRQSDAHEFAGQLLLGCQRSILFRLVGSKKLPLRASYTTSLFRVCGGYLRSQVRWSCQDEIQQLRKAGKRQEADDLEMELRNRRRNGGAAGLEPDRLVSNTYDPANMMHVDIAGQTLEHCLTKFCDAERLHGRCYLTPRDAAVVATKQMTIHVPPNVLMVHLKRFTPTGGKVSKFVKYPAQLNLRPYCTPSGGKEEGSAAGPLLYELNAVCVHEGSSINYGHYYSVVRARNGAWYECNDTSVTPLSKDRALSQQAYMLFYSRVPVEERSRSSSATHRLPGTLSSTPAQPAPQHVEVGKELREEDVAALLAKRAGAAAAVRAPAAGERESTDSMASRPTPSDSRGDGHGRELGRGEPSGSRLRSSSAAATGGGSSRETLKRMREELSTDDEAVEDDRRSDECCRAEETGETASPVDGAGGVGAPSGRPPLRKTMYGGIVKALRVNPATPLRRALAARGGEEAQAVEAPRGTDGGPVTRALGRAAVITLAEKKQQAEPETVRRSPHAPKFQQRIGDAMWEMEMDKGRLKKVKRRAAEADAGARDASGKPTNRFQEKSKNRFDIRGRRRHEGAEDS